MGRMFICTKYMRQILVFCFVILISLLSCKKNNSEQEAIISLAPTLTQILYEFDSQVCLVGVTDSCDIPKGAVAKRVGGFSSFNYEKMAKLKPTLILLMDSTSIEEFYLLEKLFGKGVIKTFMHPSNFKEIFQMIEELGRVTGYEKEAEKIIVHMNNDYVKLKNEANSLNAPKPKVFIELYYPPFYTVGKHTYLSEILELAGAINPVQTEKNWPVLTAEDFYLLKPDYILKLNQAHTQKN